MHVLAQSLASRLRSLSDQGREARMLNTALSLRITDMERRMHFEAGSE